MAVPVPVRVLAGAGALGGGALAGVGVLGYLRAACPGSAAALVLTALPLLLFLAFLAAAPDALQRLLARRTRVDLGDPAHVAAAVVLGTACFIALGWGGLVSGVTTVESRLAACGLASEPVTPTPEALVTGVVITFALFVFPIVLYVGVVHGLGPRGTFRELGLREEGAGRALALGAGLALAFLVGLALVVAAVSPWLPESVLENEQALAIARSVTLPSAFLLAVGSGLGEELFFRGFLQPRFGILATSIVFSLAHLNYGSVSEVVVVFVLSLALGLAYKLTGNLWTAVAAHFTFNFVQLLVGMYAEI